MRGPADRDRQRGHGQPLDGHQGEPQFGQRSDRGRFDEAGLVAVGVQYELYGAVGGLMAGQQRPGSARCVREKPRAAQPPGQVAEVHKRLVRAGLPRWITRCRQ